MKFDNHNEVNDILLLNFLYKKNQKIKNQILFKIKMYKWYKKVRFFFQKLINIRAIIFLSYF